MTHGTVEQVAVDHGAKDRPRQRGVARHEVADFKSAVLRDRLQRGDHMVDRGAVLEWQQQPFIGDDPAVDVVNMGNRIDRQRTLQTLVRASPPVRGGARDIRRAGGPFRCGHRRPTWVSRCSRSSGVAARRRCPPCSTQGPAVRRKDVRGGIDRQAEAALPVIKPQPGVEEIPLPDRLDDPRSCAFEVHGFRSPVPQTDRRWARIGEFSVQARACSTTALRKVCRIRPRSRPCSAFRLA